MEGARKRQRHRLLKTAAVGLVHLSFLLAEAVPATPEFSGPQPARGRVLVVITCHADDFSIFAGGSIAKLVNEGYTGYLVRITDDEKSGGPDPQHNAAQNDAEVREVSRLLKLRAVYSLHFKNDELGRVPHERVRDAIMYYLRKLKADTIYTFDPYATYGEENPDHLAGGRAAQDAARNAGNPAYAPDQLRLGILPHAVTDAYYWGRAPMEVNNVVDTSAYLDLKMEALRHHHAQFTESLVMYFRKYDQEMGRIYGMRAAEVSHHIWYTKAPPPMEQRPLPKTSEQVSARDGSLSRAATWKDKVIVVVSPHARDYVQAVGGTLIKAARQGAQIYLVRVTDDERHGGELPRVEARTKLAEETRQAARLLGIRQVIDLDLKDGEVAEVSEPELRSRFAQIFRSLAPDAVFTADPWAPYDRDADDARIGHAVEDAAWSASHVSFYPELVLEPKTRFKVIADRFFWTSNGGRQWPNHREDISSVAEVKAQAIESLATAFRGESLPAGRSEESYYYYRAANPLDWFQGWLKDGGAKAPPLATRSFDPRAAPSKRVVVITPEPSDWLVHAGSLIQELVGTGSQVMLVCIGNGEKAGVNPRSLGQVALTAGIAEIINLGYREGEWNAFPFLIVRDRIEQFLHSYKPDTVLLPDAWEPYTADETMLAGRIGADALQQWMLSEAVEARIIYWRTGVSAGSFYFKADRARKLALLTRLHRPSEMLPEREIFEIDEINTRWTAP
jgi:LmbE family N-acetylglucosaminyl deacetylase